MKSRDEVANIYFGKFLATLGDDLSQPPIGSDLTSYHCSENKTRDFTSKHMRNHVPRSSGPPSAWTVCLLLLCSCGTDSGPGFSRGMSAVRIIHDADEAAQSIANTVLIKKVFILYQSGRRRCRSCRIRAVFP